MQPIVGATSEPQLHRHPTDPRRGSLFVRRPSQDHRLPGASQTPGGHDGPSAAGGARRAARGRARERRSLAWAQHGNRSSINGWWNIGAFAPPPAGAGRIGNAGVGILEGPGTFTVVAGVAKTFGVRRGIRGRLEVTFTNIFDRLNVAPPATDVTTPATFGKTTSVQTSENAGNRTGQVALRMTF
jgi:hypothetical protein